MLFYTCMSNTDANIRILRDKLMRIHTIKGDIILRMPPVAGLREF